MRAGTILIKEPCLLLSEVSDFPCFLLLKNIYVHKNDIYYVGEVFSTEYISSDYHCHVLKSTGVLMIYMYFKVLSLLNVSCTYHAQCSLLILMSLI